MITTVKDAQDHLNNLREDEEIIFAILTETKAEDILYERDEGFDYNKMRNAMAIVDENIDQLLYSELKLAYE